MKYTNLTVALFEEATKVEDGAFLKHDGSRYFRFDRLEIKSVEDQLEIAFMYRDEIIWQQRYDEIPDLQGDGELHIVDVLGVKHVSLL